MPTRTRDSRVIWLLILGMLCGGCYFARVNTMPPIKKSEETPIPKNPGRTTYRLMVVGIRIPPDAITPYPALGGADPFGRALVSALYKKLNESQYFTFLEAEDETLQRLLDLWRLQQEGVFQEGIAIQRQPLLREPRFPAPALLASATVSGVEVCTPVEEVGLVTKALSCVTTVRVQVRFTEARFGDGRPGEVVAVGTSNAAAGEGRCSQTVQASLFTPEARPFGTSQQGQVACALEEAIHFAVVHALKEFTLWQNRFEYKTR